MNLEIVRKIIDEILNVAGIEVRAVDQRSFPEEDWLIVNVDPERLAVAQSLVHQIEAALSERVPSEAGRVWVVNFRPAIVDEDRVTQRDGGRLASKDIDQLIQLLEARSRTSDALPSLNYVEDPRTSLSAIGASRHHIVFGRRGVGKTALLLEAKRRSSNLGHATVWFNCHAVRHNDADDAFLSIVTVVLSAVLAHAGTSTADSFSALTELKKRSSALRDEMSGAKIPRIMPDLNAALKKVLGADRIQLDIYLDDFYLLELSEQPRLLDHLAGALRDCNGWLKIATIERLSKLYEPSQRLGLEVPHDASTINMDVTLEDPNAAQVFLESVLSNYTSSLGISSPRSIAKFQALGRLVLASGGVPRDYLNLFANSIVVARQERKLAREIGREDVAKAAGETARQKKRDLEEDVSSDDAERLLKFLKRLSDDVREKAYTYFLVNFSEKQSEAYPLLLRLVDLRFVHIVQQVLSDQHKPGVRYEAYVLDLSEYSEVRLRRGLDVLDLEKGEWSWRRTGHAGAMVKLQGTGLRDRLRQAPVIHISSLV